MQAKEAIQAIKERLTIVDIVRRDVQLRHNGSRWVGPCPFHLETKPSFSVNEDMGMFYCFGCHASGDLFDFYGRIHGLDFGETLAALAAELGISIEYGDGRSARERGEQAARQRNKRQTMLRLYQFAATWFCKALTEKSGAGCRNYISQRKIDQKFVERFGLGWSPLDWDALSSQLARAGFDTDLCVEAGMLGRSGKGRVYDRFRGRLIFPIRNLSGDVIAFGGRIIEKDVEQPKYINSPDTPLYKKGEHLFALNLARQAMTSRGHVILTEGYIDVVTLHQNGYENSVGVLGTALTDDQVKRLSRFVQKFLLIFDGDRAGHEAAFKAAEKILAKGLQCRIVLLPDSEDIDSFLQKQGREAFASLAASARDGLAFCADRLAEMAPRQAVEWIRNFLAQVDVPAIASPYVSQLAGRLNLSEKELREQLASRDGTRQQIQTQDRIVATPIAPLNMRERQIMMFAVRYPEHAGEISAIGGDMALHSPFAKRLFAKIARLGAESYHYLEPGEKNFWLHCVAGETPDSQTYERERDFLRRDLAAWQIQMQQNSISAALHGQSGPVDFKQSLEYLDALQHTLEIDR